MSNQDSSYWEERIANQTWKEYNTIEYRNKEMLEFYQDALREIQHSLYDYASTDGTLSRSKLYEKKQLQKLQTEINQKIADLTKQIENIAKINMLDGAENTCKNILKVVNNTGIEANDNLINKLYNQPWRGDSFSGRIWSDKNELAKQLNNSLKNGIAQGKTVTQIATEIQNAMNSNFNSTIKVVRSETMHYLNDSALHSYKQSGVKFVRVWSAEDERTCGTCSQYHNKVYLIDKAPILPLHPNCRCTIIPVLDEELTPLDVQSVYGLTDQELYAANKYVAGYFNIINDSLRRGFDLDSDETDLLKELDKALDKFPNFEGEVTRSLYFYSQKQLDGFIDSHVLGLEHLYPEYIATTKDDIYNPDSHVEIVIKNSKKGKDISLLNHKEQEVLYARENIFIPVDIVEKGDKIYIYLEEA